VPLARAGDIDLAYEAGGAAEPLLLIMGLGGTALHWGTPFLDALRARFRVIAYDHRGVGESSPLEGKLSIAQMADDAANLLAALGIERAHVLGISMGGMIAQELAIARADLLATLTIGCSYCGGPGSDLGDFAALQPLFEALQAGDFDRAVRAAWEANIAPPLVDDDAAFAEFVRVGASRPIPPATVIAQLAACRGHDTSDRLGSVTTPTQVLHGTADRIFAPLNGELIASLIPGARFERLEGRGHLFFWEIPDRTAELAGELAA